MYDDYDDDYQRWDDWNNMSPAEYEEVYGYPPEYEQFEHFFPEDPEEFFTDGNDPEDFIENERDDDAVPDAWDNDFYEPLPSPPRSRKTDLGIERPMIIPMHVPISRTYRIYNIQKQLNYERLKIEKLKEAQAEAQTPKRRRKLYYRIKGTEVKIQDLQSQLAEYESAREKEEKEKAKTKDVGTIIKFLVILYLVGTLIYIIIKISE